MTLALIRMAILLEQPVVALSIALMFHCLLRPGELSKLTRADLLLEQDTALWQT